MIFPCPEARFRHLQTLAKSDSINKQLNRAMKTIEKGSSDLSGVLQQTFTDLGKNALSVLIRLLAPIDLTGGACGATNDPAEAGLTRTYVVKPFCLV